MRDDETHGGPDFDPACDFCRIVSGEEHAAQVVCTGARWIAFLPLEPATPGHTLIVPRQHVGELWATDDDLARDLMSAVVRVGKAVRDATRAPGLNLITSAGSVAEQTVFHLHLHVVPRYPDDAIDIWPPKQRLEKQLEAEIADAIRRACGA